VLLSKPDRERGFKKERILRVVLTHAGDELTKYRVAKLADVSEPWCREYTEQLEDEGFLDGTDIRDPHGLYDHWRDTRIEPNAHTVTLQQPIQEAEDRDLTYALTTYEAENRHQGFLFASGTDLYVHPEETDEWLALIEEKGMVGGGNTRLRVTDSHVFYERQRLDGQWTVTVPQLIVDLLDEGGPATEAARKLIARWHDAEDR
jgi:hypothetical protein